MQTLNLLSYQFKILEFSDILEFLEKGEVKNGQNRQLTSLNPEILMAMRSNKRFAQVVLTSYGQIVDGVGIVLAAQMLNKKRLTRLPGVEVMDRLIAEASKRRLQCLLIGGVGQLAKDTAECYQTRYPELKIYGFQAISDIKNPTDAEIADIKRIVRSTRPQLVFASFGSPAQELWLAENQDLFPGAFLMGVGGAFAMLSGKIQRAPNVIRTLGLEWLYRLLREPWRARRQLALARFLSLIVQAKWQQK